MAQLSGKAVIVTGASSGIGAAIAQECAAQGASVVVGFSTGEERAREVVSKILAAGDGKIRAIACQMNLADDASIFRAAKHVTADLGWQVDGLVNCAGVHVSGPLLGQSAEEVRGQVDVNLTGTIRMTQALLQHFVSRRKGSIVNLGSVSAHRVIRGHAVYSATKAGLEGFTRALAGELARRQVRVNCVVPGPVLTPMLQQSIEITGDDPAQRVPLGRLVEPLEVARTVAFLLSDASSAITGAMIPVDGGYLLG